MLDRGRVSGSGGIASSGRPLASLVDLLESSRERFGPRPLFVTKHDGRWTETTYAELADAVDALRGGLAGLGVRSGDRVGIIAGNRVEWAVAAYATYGLGAAFVPMYESQSEKDWAFIVRDSGMKVLFVASGAVRGRLETLVPSLAHVVLVEEGPGLTYRGLLREGQGHLAPARHPSPRDPAALLYTSGTTGEPKGVVLTHDNVVSNALTLRDLILATENAQDHRSLSILPWAHAFGHTAELHMLIASGASMAIAESAEKIADNIKEVKPTVLFAVPRVFNKIYAGVQKLIALEPPPVRWLFQRGLAAATRRSRGRSLGLAQRLVLFLADRLVFAKVRARFGGRLKFAISGAASLAREVAEFVDAIGIAVYEGYGLTETSPIVTANVPGHRKLGSAGRVLPGVRVTIDASKSDDPRRGEIVVHGPNVMRGYHARDGETRAVLLPDGGLRTGDMGYLDEDGYLFITGRLKEQYKLANGKYVVPSPLEERLKLSPLIANVMIYGDNRPHNVALVVPDAGSLIEWATTRGLAHKTLGELADDGRTRARLETEIDRLSSEFRRYERVRSFVVITEDFTQENQMLTPSLKLRRHNILHRWQAALEQLYRTEAGGADEDSRGAASSGGLR
jgi:long-chain acyl-CoA synthetase